MKRFALIVAAAATLGSAVVSNAALVHRYTFNDGTANDSVGTANGTLVGTATISGGALRTTAQAISQTNNQGVTLPVGSDPSASAVGGITGSFTIQSIYTDAQTNPSSFFRNLFGFSTDNNNYVLGTPVRNEGANGFPSSAGLKQATSSLGGTELLLRNNSGDQGANRIFTLTYDATTGTATYYLDGNTRPAGATGGTGVITGLNLQALSTKAGINGVGPFNDLALNGSTDDYRIYNQALTQAQVTALQGLGAAATDAQIQAIVPEPTSLGLLGLGAVGLLARRRKA